MKKILFYILFFGFLGLLQAQKTQLSVEQRAQIVAEKFRQELNLDESTTKKVYEIKLKYLQEYSKREKEILLLTQKGNTTEVRKIMNEISKNHTGKVEAILTPDQLKRYKAWQKRSAEEFVKKREKITKK